MEKAKRGAASLAGATAHIVAGWQIGPLMSAGAVFMRLDYLTQQNPHPDHPAAGPGYALAPQQARELIDALASALQLLDTRGTPAEKHPRH